PATALDGATAPDTDPEMASALRSLSTMRSNDVMTPRKNIQLWRRRSEAGFLVLPPSETLLLLDVAEAALRHIEEKFPCNESDSDPKECSACNLKAAVARLGEKR